MHTEGKDMSTEKISELEMSALTQHNGGNDVDKKTSVKKKRDHQTLKEGESETHNQTTKSEHSEKSQFDLSDLVQEKKHAGLVPKGSTDQGQEKGSASRGSRQKSGAHAIAAPRLPTSKPKVWTSDEEVVLLSEILGIARLDVDLPVKKNSDIDWDDVLRKVSKKLGDDLTRTQVYEKARRLKDRYLTLERKLNAGAPRTFKNANEEVLYNFSQQIWGHSRTLRLHLEEDDEEPVLATNKRLKNELGHNTSSQPADFKHLEDAETVRITTKKGNPAHAVQSNLSESDVLSSKVHEKKVSTVNAFKDKTNKPMENPGKDGKCHAISWDTQRMLEVFHSEHQAYVKEVQNSCQLVLEEMKAKLVTVVNHAVTEAANQFPSSWIGGMNLPSFSSLQPSTLGSHEDLVGNFIAANRLECTKPALENLRKQWQQQRIEELKLTSGRLRLLLEECQMQQEQLERETRKY